MPEPRFHPRFAEKRLVEALADTPVVLIHGPRQCGKTTLARKIGDPRGYAYFSFDDEAALAAAEADPVGFVANLPERAILGEVQRVPALFPAIESVADSPRPNGRFLLTASTHVLPAPKRADSLAGRIETLRLHPLAQCEIAGRAPRFLETLFAAAFKTRRCERLGAGLAERIVAGGYPAALARATGRRPGWYRDYVETLIQRDVRDLTRMRSLEVLPRLLALAARQTARLLNVGDLASSPQLSRPTVRDCVTLLERVFLLDELPSWQSDRLSRLIKTPRLYLGDTGVACALLGVDASVLARDRAFLGQLLKTFIYQELRRQASWHDDEIRFHHFRDKDGAEVDLVLERGADRIAGVEVKAASTVTTADFRGLRKLEQAAGKRFAGGVVLYDGEASTSFGDRLHAVALGTFFETT